MLADDRARERAELRRAIADLLFASGCGCCASRDGMEDAEARLARLLRVPKYADGSGFDFPRYRSAK